MINLKIVISSKEGLHARPAQLFCSTAGKFQSVIMVRNITAGSALVLGKSILMVLSLGVMFENEIEIQASGPDEAEAIASLKALIKSNFDG